MAINHQRARGFEYKTVALPQLVRGRRRRGQSVEDMIAQTMSDAINAQAREGWEYVGADTLSAVSRSSWLSKREETSYTVLVFRRGTGAYFSAHEPEMSAGHYEQTDYADDDEYGYDDVEPEPAPARRGAAYDRAPTQQANYPAAQPEGPAERPARAPGYDAEDYPQDRAENLAEELGLGDPDGQQPSGSRKTFVDSYVNEMRRSRRGG